MRTFANGRFVSRARDDGRLPTDDVLALPVAVDLLGHIRGAQVVLTVTERLVELGAIVASQEIEGFEPTAELLEERERLEGAGSHACKEHGDGHGGDWLTSGVSCCPPRD